MASIPNNYEINIAKKETPYDKYGRHWCRVELPDTFQYEAEEKLKYLRKLFGEEFNVSMTYWSCSGSQEDDWK